MGLFSRHASCQPRRLTVLASPRAAVVVNGFATTCGPGRISTCKWVQALRVLLAAVYMDTLPLWAGFNPGLAAHHLAQANMKHDVCGAKWRALLKPAALRVVTMLCCGLLSVAPGFGWSLAHTSQRSLSMPRRYKTNVLHLGPNWLTANSCLLATTRRPSILWTMPQP